MNAKTDGWESYTDHTGRRHWRWPATEQPVGAAASLQFEAGPRHRVGLPQPQQAQQPRLWLKGK